MEFSVKAGSIAKQRTGCLVVGLYEGGKLSPSAKELDDASRRALNDVVTRGDLEGELDTTLMLHNVTGVIAERVLLVGLGRERDFGEDSYRTALSAAIRALRVTGSEEATLCLNEAALDDRDGAWKIEQAVLAVMDGMYRCGTLKSKPPRAKRALKKVIFRVADRSQASAAESAIERAVAIGEGIELARDLANLPSNVCTPAYLAEQARELGKRRDLKVDVLEQKDCEKLGMGAFLAVARGTRQPPKFIVMEYNGGNRETKPIVLVGKGITFDAGGISIKPALEMDEMKFDMCGAASVFGALHACSAMKLPLDVVGIIPATENMPGGNAVKPGDIVTTMSGQTVEILDTDGEGRLVLCDALTYAEKYKPAAVIDLATMTGGIVLALGDNASGMFSNSDELARELVDAGESAWDHAWHMPLYDDCEQDLESNFADFANIGARGSDCAIDAACFLSQFARRFPWAHLDIAGVASRSGPQKGATGRPVALLAHFLAGRTN